MQLKAEWRKEGVDGACSGVDGGSPLAKGKASTPLWRIAQPQVSSSLMSSLEGAQISKILVAALCRRDFGPHAGLSS
jgi:hypothetical protein